MASQNPKSFLVLPREAQEYYSQHSYEFVCDFILNSVWDECKPTHQQKQILDAYDKYSRLLIDSGHGSGKSSVFSWIGIHFLSTRPSDCKVPCTAPTGHQLKDVLWSNFSKYIGISLLTDDLEWMATEIRHKIMTNPHYAVARTSNRADNMQGQHAKHLLWLVDEAYGVGVRDPMLWETIEGSLTEGDNRIILAGQPTQVTGYCADIKNPKRSPEWKEPHGKILRLNSEESPLVSKDWLAGMKAKWGRTHDVYRVRVLGLPPLGNPKAFINLTDATAAVEREIEDSGQFEIGIDPAREGDDLCVLSWRRGWKFFPFETLPKSDEFQIAAMALQRVRKIRHEYGYRGRIRIKIENIGGYGSGAIDILRRNKNDNIEVIPITSGGTGNSEYANANTIMWAEIKDNLHKMSLPDDDDLIGQLCSREQMIDMKNGKLMIEPKRAYKKRMGHSPDKADALILCWTQQAAQTRMIDMDIGKCMAKLSVKWDSLSQMTIPMVGLYTDSEMKTGACVMLWKQETNKVYVVLSADFDSARPEKIIPELMDGMKRLSKGFVTNIKTFEWFGNKVYDNVGLGTVKDIWSKNGVHVRANDVFNIDGSVLAINRMLQQQRIYFDEVWAGQLPVTLQAWVSEDKENISNSVLALANLASVINDGTYIGRPTPMAPFAPEKVESIKRNEEALRMGISPDQQIMDSTNWMV